MKDRDELREQTNPVFATAKATSRFLLEDGNEQAGLLLDRLGFPREDGKGPVAEWNALSIDIRYEGANGFIDASDEPNVVDLPCGFTPRALRPELQDRRYLGLDLPAVAEPMAVAIDRMMRAEGIEAEVAFRGVDATNYASLRDALADVEGEVLVTTEGLLMYFTQTELDEMCDAMHRVLEEHGGVWMTADPETAVVTLGVLKAFYGEEALAKMVKSGGEFSRKSDSLVASDAPVALGANKATVGTAMRTWTREQVDGYFESKGFVVDREPFSAHLPEIPKLEALPEETAAKVREVYDNASMWVLSVAEDAERAPEPAEMESGDFIVGSLWAGTTLQLHLVGRLDSISAPDLLDFYEHQTKILQPARIEVDASRLAYISSAGIRTLLLFAKRVGRGNVVIHHADDFMRKVLDETGAADFFEFA